MTATIIPLRPSKTSPEQATLAGELRRIADQLETGAVVSATIIVANRNGGVFTINAPALSCEIGGLRR